MSYKRRIVTTQLPEESDKEFVQRLIRDYPNKYSQLLRTQFSYIYDRIEQKYPTSGETLYRWFNPRVEATCGYCNTPTEFVNFSTGYREYCSCSCRAKDKKSNLNGLTPAAVSKRQQWRKNVTPKEWEQITTLANTTKIEKYGAIGNPRAQEVGLSNKIKRYGEEVVGILDSYDQMYDLIVTQNLTSVSISSQLKVTPDVVKYHAKKLGIKFPTAEMNGISKAEKEIYNFILQYTPTARENVTGLLENSRKELDIYVPELSLAIEYHGSCRPSPDNKLTNATKHDHRDKLELCLTQNIKLIQIFDTDWFNKQDIIKSRLLNALGKSKRIYARKCKIVEVNATDSRLFFDGTHLQGYRPGNVTFGLEYNGELVSCMSFTKPRYNKHFQWEILRMSNKLNTTVVGAASKLFKHFIRTHNPDSIISYGDRNWGEGLVYQQLGMIFDGYTPVNYWYVDPQDPSKKKYHRSAFMKHKLVELGYSAELTESQITEQLGLCRLYDSGNSKWIWKRINT